MAKGAVRGLSGTASEFLRTSLTLNCTLAGAAQAIAKVRLFFSSSVGQGSAVPAAFTTLTARLTVQAAINKTAELELNRAIGLDGLSALQIVYL